MVLANDIVYFITTPEYLNLVKEEAGKDDYPIKNIMVMGGSRIARKPQKEIEEDEGILEVEYEAPEQEVKKETRGRKPKNDKSDIKYTLRVKR